MYECISYLKVIFCYFSYLTFSKNVKNAFYFISKSSFCSRDIQAFIFFSFPCSFPVGHGRRSWLKISFKVHDVIIYLNMKLVWYIYINRNQGLVSKRSQLIEYYFRNFFIGKLCRKSAVDAGSRRLLTFSK